MTMFSDDTFFNGKPLSLLVAEVVRQQREDCYNDICFVCEERISELEEIKHPDFDLKRLVMLCEELNVAYRHGCFITIAALTRSLLDHVPPIFGVDKFAQVASDYLGSKSFKESMTILQTSARKIGDAHLHTKIRKNEVLPTQVQINFSRELDVLLAEIVQVLTVRTS